MSYQTFSNLQLKTPLKNTFHNFHIGSRDTSGKKHPCTCRYFLYCFDI